MREWRTWKRCKWTAATFCTIRRCRSVANIPIPIRAERAVPKLSRFIKSYHDHVYDVIKQKPDTFRPIKVAIIDNGILTISPRPNSSWDILSAHPRLDDSQGIGVAENEHTKQQQRGSDVPNRDGKWPNSNNTKKYKTLWSRIKGGRSFVDDNSRVSPWLFASDPHGTQMANLICAIDPCCELYVAKVAESRSGITPERVARVGQVPPLLPPFTQGFVHNLPGPSCGVS